MFLIGKDKLINATSGTWPIISDTLTVRSDVII